jgi:transcriptional regulator with XRE-family HTH domain
MLESDLVLKSIKREMGKYFKKIRIESQISQAEAANKLAVTPQYLSNFENGRSTFSYPLIRQLIKLYGVSCESVIGFYIPLLKSKLEHDLRDAKRKSRQNNS